MIDISIPFTIMLGLWVYSGIRIYQLRKQGKKLTLRIIASAIAPEFIPVYDGIKSMNRVLRT